MIHDSIDRRNEKIAQIVFRRKGVGRFLVIKFATSGENQLGSTPTLQSSAA
jgi:hypothetical protein